MFTILIQEKGGEPRRMEFNKMEITIGRVQGNDIVLPKGNVSKKHARIVLKDNKFIIVDLKSTNGTYVNGRKISSPLVVKETDKIYIGDFIVGVDEGGGGGGALAPDDMAPPPMAPPPMAPPPMAPPAERSAPAVAMGGPGSGPAAGRPTQSVPSAVPPMGPGSGPVGNSLGNTSSATGGRRGVIPPISPARRPPGPATAPPPISSSAPPMVPPLSAQAAPPLAPPLSTPMAPPVAPPLSPPMSSPATLAPPPAATFSPPPAQPQAPPVVAQAARPITQPPPLPSAYAPAGQTPNLGPSNAAMSRPQIRATGLRPANWGQKRGVVVPPMDSKIAKLLDLQSLIVERLRVKFDLDKQPLERLADEEMWQRSERSIVDMVQQLLASGELPPYLDQEVLIKESLNEALGLGALEDLLADDSIDEIIVDKRDRVLVLQQGQLRAAGKYFSSDDVLYRVIERLAAQGGVQLAHHPMVDVRLRDGSRLTAAVPPVSTRGAALVLRKPAGRAVTLASLAGSGALSSAMVEYLDKCIAARRNILVCGGPSAGKTALIAALAQGVPAGERIVSIEDVAELGLAREEWIALETRPADGKVAGIDVTALFHKALRLLPDRIVVGDVTGSEAATIIGSLAASCDGVIVGGGGEGAANALARMMLLARGTLDEATARELTANAFETVVHVSRSADGKLRVIAIDEVVGYSELGFEVTNLFGYKDGNFVASGARSRLE